MESLQKCFFKQALVSTVTVGLMVCSSSVASVAAQISTGEADSATVLLTEQKKEKVNTPAADEPDVDTTKDPSFDASEPSEVIDRGDGIDGMTLLYIGGAVGVIAVGAVALGGGGGSSSSGSEPLPLPSSTPVVGPNLNGANWRGFLEIKDRRAQGFQNVSATCVQNGSSVQITTSSTLKYGRMFSGRINNNGFMLMYDSVTGEDWTTHFRNASVNRVDLYDYVNGLKDLDRMLLTR